MSDFLTESILAWNPPRTESLLNYDDAQCSGSLQDLTAVILYSFVEVAVR